jgi:hypothetical protein
MNSLIAKYARDKIKEGLLILSERHRMRFKRMYSARNLKRPIDDIIKNLPDEKLNWALTQVQNTLKGIRRKGQVKEE